MDIDIQTWATPYFRKCVNDELNPGDRANYLENRKQIYIAAKVRCNVRIQETTIFSITHKISFKNLEYRRLERFSKIIFLHNHIIKLILILLFFSRNLEDKTKNREIREVQDIYKKCEGNVNQP